MTQKIVNVSEIEALVEKATVNHTGFNEWTEERINVDDLRALLDKAPIAIGEVAYQCALDAQMYQEKLDERDKAIEELKENLRRAKSAADAEALEVDSRGELIAELVEALKIYIPKDAFKDNGCWFVQKQLDGATYDIEVSEHEVALEAIAEAEGK